VTVNLSPVIKVAGQPLDTKWLDRLSYMRVHRQLGLVGRTVLRFADSGASLAAADLFTLGTEVTVAQNDGPTVFDGTVTGLSLDQGGERVPELVVTIDDAAYKLARGTTTKAYLNSTYTDVVSALAGDAGLSLSGTVDTTVYEYLLQSGTNLDYLNEATARAGCVWWVEGASTLKVAKAGTSQGSVSLTLGDDLERFSVRASGLTPDGIQVVGWDPAQQAALVGDAKTTSTKESDLVGGFPGRTSGSAVLVVRDASPLTQGEATALATSIFETAKSETVEARGTTDFNGSIAPGVTVSVATAGPASGSYLVTSVEHTYDSKGAETRFVAGSLRPSALVDVLAPERDSGFSIDGVLAAVVTNVADPDNKGRVKVKYSTQGDTVESPWARIATIGAGKGRGFEFQPEVNDEVLVAFELGDTRRPVVLGGLFSDKNTLPTSAKPGNVDGSTIAYRRITSRLGHVVELADGTSPDTKHILLKLADGKASIRVGADKLDITTDKLAVNITNGQGTITLADNGDITLDGNNVTIKAKSNVSIQATSQLSAKGSQASVEGQSQLTVKSGGMGSVEASGPLTVKGAMVAIN